MAAPLMVRISFASHVANANKYQLKPVFCISVAYILKLYVISGFSVQNIHAIAKKVEGSHNGESIAITLVMSQCNIFYTNIFVTGNILQHLHDKMHT